MQRRNLNFFPVLSITFFSVAVVVILVVGFETTFPNFSKTISLKVNSWTTEYCNSRQTSSPSLKWQFTSVFAKTIKAHLMQQGNFTTPNRILLIDNSDSLLTDILDQNQIKTLPPASEIPSQNRDMNSANTENNDIKVAKASDNRAMLYELEIFRKSPTSPKTLIVQISTFDEKSKNKIAESALEINISEIFDKKKPDSNE